MKRRIFLSALLLMGAGPALAEKLAFDHRLSPELSQVLEAGDPAMVSFNDANPRYLVDVIAVRGTSARDWTEALVIIARSPGRKVASVESWMEELRRESQRRCRGTYTVLARDPQSITFERQSVDCPPGYPPVGIYRVVQGKTSLFLLAAMAKDGISASSRAHWLALMESARLE